MNNYEYLNKVLKDTLIKARQSEEKREHNLRNRGPIDHYIKISTEFFEDVRSGKKPFELRFNDRDYRVGDTLLLEEYNSELCAYTRRLCVKLITYVLEDTKYMQEGYVALGLGEAK